MPLFQTSYPGGHARRLLLVAVYLIERVDWLGGERGSLGWEDRDGEDKDAR